jgi:arylsulfatase A-like enzyme
MGNHIKTSIFRHSLEIMLICVALGVVLGLSWAIIECWQNDYVSLGFWKNFFIEFRTKTIQTGTVGGIVGVILILLRLLNLICSRLGLSVLSNLREVFKKSQNGKWPYLICLSCALLSLAIRSTIQKWGNGPVETFGIIIAVILWSIFFTIFRRKTNLQNSSWFQSKLLTEGFYTLSVLVILIFPFLDKQTLKEYVVLEVVATGLITAAMVVFVIVWYQRKRLFKIFVDSVLLPVIFIIPIILWIISPYVLSTGIQTVKPWNCILIGIDTLRSDHTNLQSYPSNYRILTPNLQKLAKRGTIFQSAISQAPWTMPAFASILTGKYPHEHGAISLHGSLRKEAVTLAEIMREAGYFTAAVVSHFYVNAIRGFSQGFDSFNEDYVLGHGSITSEQITDEAIKVLDTHNSQSFFVFLHYFDPHFDWQNHNEWDFSDAYSGWLREEPHDIRNLRVKRHLLGASDINYLKDLYAEEIAYTDKHIGRLFDYLEKKKLDSKTLIIVVADHGEEFMERGWLGHTKSLHEEVIKVPLLVVLPKFDHKNPIAINTIETRSIFSMILDYIGLPFYSEGLAPSLVPMFQKNEVHKIQDISHSAYSSVWLPDAPVHSGNRVKISALHTNRWKLIIDHTRQQEYLFNLEKDPGETTNLIAEETKVLQKMRPMLKDWLRKMLKTRHEIMHLEMRQEEINKLISLGYVQ